MTSNSKSLSQKTNDVAGICYLRDYDPPRFFKLSRSLFTSACTLEKVKF